MRTPVFVGLGQGVGAPETFTGHLLFTDAL